MTYFRIVRLLFGLPLRDTQTGLKVFKREVLQCVFPRILAKRFAFDIEVLANAHRLGYKLVSAPVRLEFRRTLGRIRFKDVFTVGADTLAIFYRMHILHYYDRFKGERWEQTPVDAEAREYARFTEIAHSKAVG